MFNKKRNRTMKKIYKNPELRIVKVKTAQLLGNSLGIQGEAQGSTMLSRQRGGSVWDDDESEDY